MDSKKNTDIIDVANSAGVSPATVSRCFNHPDMVKPDTRKRIQKAVEETGYIRNRAAQAIHGRRSGTIGLIVPTLDNAIFSNLIQSFSEEVARSGFTMLVATHGYDLEREYQLLRSLLEHRVEGVALIGQDHQPETFGLLSRRSVPVVSMWNYDPKSTVSCVGADNYEAGRAIAQYVLDNGHRDVGVAFPMLAGNDRAQNRLLGVQSVLCENGISVRDEWQLETSYSIKKSRQAAEKLLCKSDRPTAIIAGNDIIAQGVIFAGFECGLRIPDDLSVSGIGDFAEAEFMYPSLTTVRLRPAEVGRRAGEILVDQINRTTDVEIQRVAIELALKRRKSVSAV